MYFYNCSDFNLNLHMKITQNLMKFTFPFSDKIRRVDNSELENDTEKIYDLLNERGSHL